jgi:hypothetical protein
MRSIRDDDQYPAKTVRDLPDPAPSGVVARIALSDAGLAEHDPPLATVTEHEDTEWTCSVHAGEYLPLGLFGGSRWEERGDKGFLKETLRKRGDLQWRVEAEGERQRLTRRNNSRVSGARSLVGAPVNLSAPPPFNDGRRNRLPL